MQSLINHHSKLSILVTLSISAHLMKCTFFVLSAMNMENPEFGGPMENWKESPSISQMSRYSSSLMLSEILRYSCEVFDIEKLWNESQLAARTYTCKDVRLLLCTYRLLITSITLRMQFGVLGWTFDCCDTIVELEVSGQPSRLFRWCIMILGMALIQCLLQLILLLATVLL